MIATWVPAALTPSTPEHVSRAYRTALTSLVGAPTDLAVAVLHAHGALETGHFKSCYNNNGGNIKAGAKYQGQYTCFPILNEREMRDGKLVTIWYSATAELVGGKNGPPRPGTEHPLPPGHPQSRFRAYSALAAGIEDKIRFLATGKWRAALQWALDGKPDAYVRAIRSLGYFTADLDPYVRAVVSLTAKYLPVAEATAASLPAPALEEDDLQTCEDMAACHRFELPDWLVARLTLLRAEHIDDAMDQVRRDRDRDIRGDD